MKKEIWKDIKGYEGLYQVSNYGRVKSLERYFAGRNQYSSFKIHVKEKILKQSMDDDGYCMVGLHKEGTQKMKRINRLVAEAFIPNPENKPIVGHLKTMENGLEDKTANEAWNLQWMTPLENSAYGTLSERKKEMMKKEYESGKREKVWLNKKRPEHAKKLAIPIVEINGNGEIIEWDSIIDCHRAKNCSLAHLVNAVNGKNRNKGHHFKQSQFYKKSDYEKTIVTPETIV